MNLAEPRIYVATMVGAMLTFFFSALTIRAVGNAAHSLVAEVRRQFREVHGLADGLAAPDCAPCVRIATASALKGMVWPALVAVVSPFVIFFVLGVEAVGGLLLGNNMRDLEEDKKAGIRTLADRLGRAARAVYLVCVILPPVAVAFMAFGGVAPVGAALGLLCLPTAVGTVRKALAERRLPDIDARTAKWDNAVAWFAEAISTCLLSTYKPR